MLLIIQFILWCQKYAIYIIYDIVAIIGKYIADEDECSEWVYHMFSTCNFLDKIETFYTGFLLMIVLYYFADMNFENMRDYMRGSDHDFNTYRDTSVANA